MVSGAGIQAVLAVFLLSLIHIFQQLGALVVERSLPPVFDDEFGNEHRDLTMRMVMFDLQDVLDKRHDDEAVG